MGGWFAQRLITKIWVPDRQHRRSGVSNDLLGHTPQKHMTKPGKAVGTQDNEVHHLLLCHGHDLIVGKPFPTVDSDLDAG